jgi:hypothetical protein
MPGYAFPVLATLSTLVFAYFERNTNIVEV